MAEIFAFVPKNAGAVLQALPKSKYKDCVNVRYCRSRSTHEAVAGKIAVACCHNPICRTLAMNKANSLYRKELLSQRVRSIA